MARPGVTFFEVDLPATQADKRRRAPQGGPVYVPADVTAPILTERLVEAGFRLDVPTAFTVEGLTMYLSEGQVGELLRTLARLGGPAPAWPSTSASASSARGVVVVGSVAGSWRPGARRSVSASPPPVPNPSWPERDGGSTF